MVGSTRMSMEEKRKAILNVYHQTKGVYTEKEIVTLASKAGVNMNTIVDVNQSLVDDGLVDKEKIGGSNYFWSFPAKKDRLMQIQYQKTLAEIENLKGVLQETNAKLLDAKRGREDDEDTPDQMEDNEKNDPGNQDGKNETSDEKKPNTKMTRTMKLQRLNEITLEKSKLLNEINILKENDPQVVADLEKELNFVKEAANRWTDNIFNCKSYLIKKRNMDKKEAHRVLGITDAFDYPEDKIPR